MNGVAISIVVSVRDKWLWIKCIARMAFQNQWRGATENHDFLVF